MFTGIVTDVGRVRAVRKTGSEHAKGEGRRFEISTAFDIASIDLGASIAHGGACMTVVEKGSDWYAFEASAESLDKTTMGTWQVGQAINLERAMRLGDELGGHMVSGHIDDVGRVVSREPVGDSVAFGLSVPPPLVKFLAPKGSITIDGVSLTINTVAGNILSVNVIPHSQTATTIGALQVGDQVNVEIDMLARYVARLLGQE